ncbi:DUF4124 domain-containing protein [Halomonadaceae bacterium KBTZ08]
MMHIVRHLTLFIALLIALPASAEIYRWTDDNGETHFGSTPPTGVDAQPVSATTTNAISNANAPLEGGKDGKADAQPQNASDETGDQQENSEEMEKQRQAKREENCKKTQKALKTLKNNARVQVKEDGKRRFLSPKEKEAKRKEYEQLRDKYCD